MKRRFGGDFGHQIDTGGIFVGFILVRIVLFANGDFAQGGALFTEVRDDGSSIDSRISGPTL